MTTIYLMRHGQSQHNAAFETGGEFASVDELGSHLTDIGREEALQAAQKLQGLSFDAIYSSDYHRARQTAELIAQDRHQSVTSLSQLRERHWGSLQGKNYGPVLDEFRQLQQGLSDLDKMRVKLTDDMESELDGAERLQSALNKLAAQHPDQQILVVNHGNIMRSFLILLGFGTHTELASGAVANCGFVVLDFSDKGWEVKSYSGVNKKVLT